MQLAIVQRNCYKALTRETCSKNAYRKLHRIKYTTIQVLVEAVTIEMTTYKNKCKRVIGITARATVRAALIIKKKKSTNQRSD